MIFFVLIFVILLFPATAVSPVFRAQGDVLAKPDPFMAPQQVRGESLGVNMALYHWAARDFARANYGFTGTVTDAQLAPFLVPGYVKLGGWTTEIDATRVQTYLAGGVLVGVPLGSVSLGLARYLQFPDSAGYATGGTSVRLPIPQLTRLVDATGNPVVIDVNYSRQIAGIGPLALIVPLADGVPVVVETK